MIELNTYLRPWIKNNQRKNGIKINICSLMFALGHCARYQKELGLGYSFHYYVRMKCVSILHTLHVRYTMLVPYITMPAGGKQ